MASGLGLSVRNAPPVSYDFACLPCKETIRNSQALYNCVRCQTLYCKPCAELHGKLFKIHRVLGRDKIQQWIVKSDNDLEICREHENETLKLFCQDHDAVCCTICVSVTHRTCKEVKPLSGVASGFRQNAEFQRLHADISATKSKVHVTKYAKQIAFRKLNDSRTVMKAQMTNVKHDVIKMFDDIETKTVAEMNALISGLVKTVQDDTRTCTTITDNLQQLIGIVEDKCQKSDNAAFIGYRMGQEKIADAEKLLTEMTNEEQQCTFQEDENIKSLISGINTFGLFQLTEKTSRNSNNADKEHVYTLHGVQKCSARVRSDNNFCLIKGICQTRSGNIVAVDSSNKTVKLLNEKFAVTEHCDLTEHPYDICYTVDDEIVVTTQNGLQFLDEQNGKLKLTRKIDIEHCSYEVNYCNGLLYVTSDTAIYLYTRAGKMLKKMYEDTSGGITVNGFALNDDRSRIYVTDSAKHLLVTLDRNGNKLATLGDESDLVNPIAVCVGENGNVFVGGHDSSTVIQVDRDGTRKLSTVAIESDGVKEPWSIWFNRKTSQLLVGQAYDDNIVAFNLK